MLHRLVPMHGVTVAEHIHFVGLVQTFHCPHAPHRDLLQQFAPGIAYLLIAGFTAWSTAANLIAELLHTDLSQFQIEKHVCLLAFIHIAGNLVGTDSVEGLDALMPVEVYQDATEVEDYILYSVEYIVFHH